MSFQEAPKSQKNAHIYLKYKRLHIKLFLGGERGIRTPGPVTVNGFQDRRIRPLCHLSGAKIGAEGITAKKRYPE
jgi:hypothetical protein